MKIAVKIIFLLSIIVASLFYGCEEEGPYINLTPEVVDTSLFDTTYISSTSVTPDLKKILIEDFTGARCPNCPNAAQKLHEIDSAYPGRIIGMAIHPTGLGFTYPHDTSKDYRTNDGTLIFQMLNGAGTLPIGAIDRKILPPETTILVSYDKWKSLVDQRVSDNSPINLKLESTPHKLEPNTFVVRVEAQYTEAVTGKNYITIALQEGNLVSPQSLPNGTTDTFYTNNHVLRDVLTNPTGNFLMDNPEMNRVFIKEFKVKMDNKWNPDNCHFVAFIHNSGASFDVLQVEEIELK
ncbi:Omp28-related outer membrane protein [Bacteroidota bacterium]